jgi:hypothetical protein
MRPHTEYPALTDLPKLIHEQRRLVAGRIRIEREERAMREKIDALMVASAIEVVSCEIHLGTFEVRRAVTRDGHRYASVTPIKGDAESTTAK